MHRNKLSKVEKKLELRERKYITEQLIKNKRSEEWEVLEEVFDRPTLFRLYNLLSRGILSKIHGSIKAGKEN